jgi:hypothetical protein
MAEAMHVGEGAGFGAVDGHDGVPWEEPVGPAVERTGGGGRHVREDDPGHRSLEAHAHHEGDHEEQHRQHQVAEHASRHHQHPPADGRTLVAAARRRHLAGVEVVLAQHPDEPAKGQQPERPLGLADPVALKLLVGHLDRGLAEPGDGGRIGRSGTPADAAPPGDRKSVV